MTFSSIHKHIRRMGLIISTLLIIGKALLKCKQMEQIGMQINSAMIELLSEATIAKVSFQYLDKLINRISICREEPSNKMPRALNRIVRCKTVKCQNRVLHQMLWKVHNRLKTLIRHTEISYNRWHRIQILMYLALFLTQSLNS